MAASTIFQVVVFISLSICVWTLPTITKRQSDECSHELIELLKGVEVSRMVLKNRLTGALNMNKDLYQAVADISNLLEYQKIISEGDISLAVKHVLNVTLKTASQWIRNFLSYIYSFSYTTQEDIHQIILMTKSHEIITTIYSELRKYNKCHRVHQCQWIEDHILNNTYSSIPDCVKQYIVDYGPGICSNTTITGHC